MIGFGRMLTDLTHTDPAFFDGLGERKFSDEELKPVRPEARRPSPKGPVTLPPVVRSPNSKRRKIGNSQ